MKLTNNAKILLDTRYFQPNETWPKLSRRVAKAVANAEKTDGLKKKWTDQFVSIIESGEFIPATPFLMNAGVSDHFFSCYVLPVGDSLNEIYAAIANAARIFQMAGGVGYDFSSLRPKGCKTTKNPKGVSSGPVSFMKVFDASCNEITQGGCVIEGTRIALADGTHVKIETLARDIMPVAGNNKQLCVDVANDLGGPKETSTFFNNGVADVIRLTTVRGYMFAATPNHKIRVIDNNGQYVWRELGAIKEDDWVALRDNTSREIVDESLVPSVPSIDFYKTGHGNEAKCKAPTEWSPKLAQFLGFWFGDGFYCDTGIGFSISNKEIHEKYAALGGELFGLTPTRREAREGDNSWFLYFHSNVLRRWLKEAIVLNHDMIPEDIQTGHAEVQNAFMRGWFDADGSITKDGYPSISSARSRVIVEAQKLLLALGMITTRRTSPRINAFTDGDQYSLVISGDRSRTRYYAQIGFTRKELVSRFYTEPKHHNTSDVLPNQAVRIKEWLTEPELVGTRISYGKANLNPERPSLYKSFERFMSRGISLSRSKATKLIEQYPEDLVGTWIDGWVKGDLVFDQIKTIEQDRAQTYDLEVPDTHTYIADGWVSHNSRKGAQMGTLRISHPDIEQFVEAKQDLSQLTQFNVSCTITDEFMDAVKNDKEFHLTFPSHPQMDRTIKARDLWKKIVHCAWRTGDPGLIFIDEVNRKDTMGGIAATNPCAEQPLPSYGCCDLGSIDLAKMFNKKGEFDTARYVEVIEIATRFLDNAIDVNTYTLPEIKAMQTGERRIGLGIMGFADALIESGIPYDSDGARHWAESIAKTLAEVTRATSEALAEEKGAFPFQSKSKLKDAKPIRNCMLTTIAPTGSISMVAGCSSGIEPIFALVFTRKHDLEGNEELVEVNNAFQRVAIERGFYSEDLMAKLIANNGSCQRIKEVPPDVQEVFKVSADLFPTDHVNMLATWQKHIQSGVSKTINLAESATESDVEKAYWQAYESGCKGITVFRDKCRGGLQVLNTGATDITMAERPEIVAGATMKVNTALGKMYITVNKMQNGEEKPFEVFVELSKGGNNAAADAEGIARLVSLALRSKVDVREIVEQLKGIGAGEVAFNKGRVVSSIPDAVAYVLERMCLNGEEKVEHPDTMEKPKYFPSGSQLATCVDCG